MTPLGYTLTLVRAMISMDPCDRIKRISSGWSHDLDERELLVVKAAGELWICLPVSSRRGHVDPEFNP